MEQADFNPYNTCITGLECLASRVVCDSTKHSDRTKPNERCKRKIYVVRGGDARRVPLNFVRPFTLVVEVRPFTLVCRIQTTQQMDTTDATCAQLAIDSWAIDS